MKRKTVPTSGQAADEHRTTAEPISGSGRGCKSWHAMNPPPRRELSSLYTSDRQIMTYLCTDHLRHLVPRAPL